MCYSKSIFEIGQYFAKIWTKTEDLLFSPPYGSTAVILTKISWGMSLTTLMMNELLARGYVHYWKRKKEKEIKWPSMITRPSAACYWCSTVAVFTLIDVASCLQ